MNEAASSCKISVITRMQKYSTGSRFVTSIWTVSDDRRIRLQHKRRFLFVGENRVELTNRSS